MKIIEWLATAATLASVLFFNLHNPLFGATIGGIGNIFWLFWAHDGKHNGLFVVNAAMLIMNAYGLANLGG